MITNSKQVIVADFGIRWARFVAENDWWSVEPAGYRIRPEQYLWLLYRPGPSSSMPGVVIDQRIFLGHTYEECMRVAEIYEIRRYR